MTAGIEAPAREATTLLNTNESWVFSVMGYAVLTFSMVVYLPKLIQKIFLLILLTASFMPNFSLWGGPI